LKSFAQIDIENNGNYLKLISAVSKLSGLFSESAIPYINYRVAENIFCKSFDAGNLSRSDTAFDANYNSVGVGIKTFTCTKKSSNEKIAEFNTLSRQLKGIKDEELAIKLSQFRNDRIDSANRTYNIDSSLYHIVARKENALFLFETDYRKIDINNISKVKTKDASLQFEDGNNLYSFNFSKSTLFRKFEIPTTAYKLPVDIIEDPYSLLLELFNDETFTPSTSTQIRGVNFVILPLYGFKNKHKFVFDKSGLNQWNAARRKRDFGELYIPIPSEIHKLFPNFFPSRDTEFNLQIPTGEIFTAKLCQDGKKALMSNPNKALSEWLLRTVLGLKEGELATIEKMESLGFDSVFIQKISEGNYKIDKAKTSSYEQFIEQN
jgi:hypothetical protein